MSGIARETEGPVRGRVRAGWRAGLCAVAVVAAPTAACDRLLGLEPARARPPVEMEARFTGGSLETVGLLPAAPPGPGYVLAGQSLQLRSRSCGASYCVTGGLLP